MDTATIIAIKKKLFDVLIKPVLLYMHGKFGACRELYHHTKQIWIKVQLNKSI